MGKLAKGRVICPKNGPPNSLKVGSALPAVFVGAMLGFLGPNQVGKKDVSAFFRQRWIGLRRASIAVTFQLLRELLREEFQLSGLAKLIAGDAGSYERPQLRVGFLQVSLGEKGGRITDQEEKKSKYQEICSPVRLAHGQNVDCFRILGITSDLSTLGKYKFLFFGPSFSTSWTVVGDIEHPYFQQNPHSIIKG